MRHRTIGQVLTTVVVLHSVWLVAGEPISPQQFGRLHALIRPNETEDRWLQIPWITSLWEARQRAAAQGKPILLWEMDGHPLGCT